MTQFYERWAVVFMRNLMRDFRCGVYDSAAIVGNAGHESGGFKSLQELKPLIPGSKGGYGIMQWTGPRRRAYEAFCRKHGMNPADMEANYRFLAAELKGPEGRVLSKMMAVTSLNAKVEVFCKVFLRPGIVHMDSRKKWAQRALDAYRKAEGGPTPAKPKPAPTVIPAPKTAIPAPKGGMWGALLAILAAAGGIALAILKSKGII